MAVAMKKAVFWNVTTYGSCKNQGFGGTQCLHHRVTRIGELGMLTVATDACCEEIHSISSQHASLLQIKSCTTNAVTEWFVVQSILWIGVSTWF
jgi:hypothetical protein